ncbi:hypothetical protein IMZ48_14820, partial [Candidatus Bathyarchaeota archaeon]|nr:hypothetical protein [Candidatus Bathyarchaeota archaeon]
FTAIEQLGKIFIEGGIKLGQSFTIVEDGVQQKALEEAGFEDIVVKDFKVREQGPGG